MSKTNGKYLYGAAVQGIQGFIFQTNKLKEIVGASEIVAEICTTAFDEYEKNGESIVRAAGNIKYIFNTYEDCEKAVSNFPQKVMTMAPGITISQAVVELKIDKDRKINLSDYRLQSNELEKRLRIQRNKAAHPMTLGFMAVKRAPSTGLPGVRYDKKEGGGTELIDEASALKRVASGKSFKLAKEAFRENVKLEEIAFNIEEITDKNNWIAVIHADGNGLGNIFQIIGKDPDDIQKFSSKLDEITKISARVAFQIVERYFYKDNKKKIPFRPVVLSGDDLTMICRADLAIEYTQLFLEEFERISIKELSELNINNETAKELLKEGLTACAGISFVKVSYPFHYAVNLSESLCKRAKEKTKKLVEKEDSKLPPSCLMFYKVQDSFMTDIKEIISRTLTPQEKISLEFGPYYCGKRADELAPRHADCYNTIDVLMYKADLLKSSEKGNALKSNLRQWLTCLFEDEGKANQRMMRIKNVGEPDIVEKLDLDDYTDLQKGRAIAIPFYDMLSVVSLNMEAKSKKREEDIQ